MKTIAIIALLAILMFSFGGKSDSKAIDKCPNGHNTFKDIPIVYGLPPFEGPEAKKWVDDIAAGKFVGGGCVVTPDSPRVQVTCTTCGFGHIQYLPDSGTWTRSSTDRKSFKTRFTELATSFPTPSPKEIQGPVEYTQIMDDQLHVDAELLSYSTSESLDTVRRKVTAWLKHRKLDLKMTTAHHKASETFDGQSRDIIQWSFMGRISIDVAFKHSDRRCYVSLSHSIDQ